MIWAFVGIVALVAGGILIATPSVPAAALLLMLGVALVNRFV